MVSRENKVIFGFGAVALALTYALVLLTDVPRWAAMAALFAVGIVAPQLLLNYLDRRERTST